jgi:transketolase
VPKSIWPSRPRSCWSAKKIAARVVNMPSWELFEKNPEDYKKEVLPPDVTARLAVEAGTSMGWERYVGSNGKVIGMTRLRRFGARGRGSGKVRFYG